MASNGWFTQDNNNARGFIESLALKRERQLERDRIREEQIHSYRMNNDPDYRRSVMDAAWLAEDKPLEHGVPPILRVAGLGSAAKNLFNRGLGLAERGYNAARRGYGSLNVSPSQLGRVDRLEDVVSRISDGMGYGRTDISPSGQEEEKIIYR